MQSLPKFRPGLPAQKVDSELKTALKIKDMAHQCSLDWFGEILNRKLFRELGYGSINQYAKEELRFSQSKIGHYISLTRKLEKLPILKDSVSKGDLGYTVARVVAEVADSNNEQEWVDFALQNSRRRVEDEVKRARQEARDKAVGQPALLPQPDSKTPKAALPVRVSFQMTPTQFARYEKLMEQIRKNRKISSEKVEVLLEIMAGFLDQQPESVSKNNSAPRGYLSQPSTQIHIHHCPQCNSSRVQTGQGELEIGEQEFQRAQCDCQVSGTGERNKTTIAPAIRREVFAHARHKCETPGCNHTRFLEIHHIVPRSAGGNNELKNLKLLCSSCHSLVHRPRHLVGEALGCYQFRQIAKSWHAAKRHHGVDLTGRNPRYLSALNGLKSSRIADWQLPTSVEAMGNRLVRVT